jgi:hypothetical protein
MRDNDRKDKERTRSELTVCNNNMVTLKEEVVHLNETQNVMKEKIPSRNREDAQ